MSVILGVVGNQPSWVGWESESHAQVLKKIPTCETCVWSVVIHFDQLQVLVFASLTFKTDLETAETVKLLPCSSILRFTALSHFDRFSRHLAPFATVIFIRPAHLNIWLGCSCRSVGNHFVEKLDHSFMAIFSGPMCWQRKQTHLEFGASSILEVSFSTMQCNHIQPRK